jgi:hypothetical protein
LAAFLQRSISQYNDLLAIDDERDLTIRQAMIAQGSISQPLPLKRLYLSLAHTRPLIDHAGSPTGGPAAACTRGATAKFG